MIDTKAISRIYFIGIGGIGMSALARYYRHQNATVSGYDKTLTPLTRQMQNEGIAIHYEDRVELADKDAQMVVYTPAIPKDHQELNYFLQHDYPVVKRSELLGAITRSGFNICIGGTHGKTTISTMVGHILRDSGYGCTAFLGGISANYQTNFWSSDHPTFVIEADEYDRSFLKLSADIALISAMDADHLDIYGTRENMEKSFVEFSKRLKPGGLLITKWGLDHGQFTADTHLRYSLHDHQADAYASNITVAEGSYRFDVVTQSGTLQDVELKMGGMHNIENAVAAIVIATHLEIEPSRIKKAVASFKGVKRRFEYILGPQSYRENEASETNGGSPGNNTLFIDDYAHHPEELSALISGARGLFPKRKCTVIFQPHLFSRTRDFAEAFARSLDKADAVILLPIYPARELPIEGITSDTILKLMKNENRRLLSREGVLEYVNAMASKKEKDDPGAILITAGAGNIDELIEPIKKILTDQEG
jgi:UDP-N-acetylmuramate--alanine ligase